MAPPIGKSRVPEWLDKRGKKPTDLAGHLKVSDSYISQVILGKRQLSVENMRRTALYLHCTMDDLVDWVDDLKSLDDD